MVKREVTNTRLKNLLDLECFVLSVSRGLTGRTRHGGIKALPLAAPVQQI